VHPTKLDHVALRVSEPRRAAAALLARLPFRIIEETDEFVLVGRRPELGKVTLFRAPDAPREPGQLLHVAIGIPCATATTTVLLDRGLVVRLVPGERDGDIDLDHVALRVPDPLASVRAWLDLGFEPASRVGAIERVRLGDALVELHPGAPPASDRPLLDHLGLLVESFDDARASAIAEGLVVRKVVDAENSRALFLAGPDGVEVELVEHKPSFALA